MTTVIHPELSRHDRRHPEALPELMTKKQVSDYLQVSQRQCEILTAKGRIPRPIYLGESSPRWKRSELLAALDAQQTPGGAT